jgi:hypothetical protein
MAVVAAVLDGVDEPLADGAIVTVEGTRTPSWVFTKYAKSAPVCYAST